MSEKPREYYAENDKWTTFGSSTVWNNALSALHRGTEILRLVPAKDYEELQAKCERLEQEVKEYYHKGLNDQNEIIVKLEAERDGLLKAIGGYLKSACGDDSGEVKALGELARVYAPYEYDKALAEGEG